MYGHVFRIIWVSTVLLTLVACAQRQAPAPVSRVYQGPSIHDFEPNSLAGESYQVAPGDTLYSIAFRANVDVRTLAHYNDLSEPYTIFPGQELRLAPPVTSVSSRAETTTTRQVVDSTEQKRYREDKRKEKVANSEPKPEVKPNPERQSGVIKPQRRGSQQVTHWAGSGRQRIR